MNFRDFRIGWRLLAKEPGYSALVIASLAIGFAVCFLLLGFAQYCLSYDRQVAHADQIHLVKFRPNIVSQPYWLEVAPLPLMDVAERSGMASQVAGVAQITSSVRVGDHVQSMRLLAVSHSFQDMFAIEPLEGDLKSVLSRPDALALTQETARKLFGDTAVLGKTVLIEGRPYQVAALLSDPPRNSTVQYEALASFQTTIWPEEVRTRLQGNWGSIGGAIYVRLAPGAAAEALEQYLQDAADRSPLQAHLPVETLQKLGHNKIMDIKLGALPERYFDPDTAASPGSGEHGSKQQVFGFVAIALLILALAATNYVNLATVRTIKRRREIGMRKVLGASAGRVAGQFMAESLVVALIASVLGLLLAMALQPLFSDLVNRRLDGMFTPWSVVLGIGFGIVVGLVSGIYPAWMALRVRATQVLAGRGDSETAGGMLLRRTLTVLQYATAIGLAAMTTGIAWQTSYAARVDPGFDQQGLLAIELPGDLLEPANRAFRDVLARVPGVRAVGAADEAIGSGSVGMNALVHRSSSVNAMMQVRTVSREFFDAYGIAPSAGRLFDPAIDPPDHAAVAVLNASAALALGYASPEAAVGQLVEVGKRGDQSRSLQVLGIAPDIRHQGLRHAARPMIYQIGQSTPFLTVRIDGDPAQAEQDIEAAWRRSYPNEVLLMTSVKAAILDNYADDIRLAKLLTASTIIAFAIAAFGIYVLSAYSVERRAREIVLRKLHGAGKRSIAMLMGREFGLLVGLGAVLGLPVAALATANYLAEFVERAPIGPWALLLALFAGALIAFLSTLRHSLAALRIPPARVLRY